MIYMGQLLYGKILMYYLVCSSWTGGSGSSAALGADLLPRGAFHGNVASLRGPEHCSVSLRKIYPLSF